MACPSASAPLDMLCSSRAGLMFRSLLWGPSVFFSLWIHIQHSLWGVGMNSIERAGKKYDTTMVINTNWKGSDPDRCTIGNSLYKLLSGFFRQKTSLTNYPICIISWKKIKNGNHSHLQPQKPCPYFASTNSQVKVSSGPGIIYT